MEATESRRILAECSGSLDLPQDLTQPIPALMVETYFGTPGPDRRTLIDWTTLLFWYLFIDIQGDPDLDKRALEMATQFRVWLDGLIRDRKAHSTSSDDVLNRALAMQRADLPGMDDLTILNNLLGFLMGAIPTLSRACLPNHQRSVRPSWGHSPGPRGGAVR